MTLDCCRRCSLPMCTREKNARILYPVGAGKSKQKPPAVPARGVHNKVYEVDHDDTRMVRAVAGFLLVGVCCCLFFIGAQNSLRSSTTGVWNLLCINNTVYSMYVQTCDVISSRKNNGTDIIFPDSASCVKPHFSSTPQQYCT